MAGLITKRELSTPLKEEIESHATQLAHIANSPQNYGAKADGITNDTQAFNLAFAENPYTVIPDGHYKLHKFQGVANQNVIGRGKPKIDLYYDAQLSTSVVLAGLSNNSAYENLHFNCLETELENNRTDLQGKENVFIKNCRFEGFRHGTSPTNANAWGIYLKNSKRITLENCEFENNTQSDIALLDGCEDITIINAKGTNLHLNLEPNYGGAPIKRIKVIGGHYKMVRLFENSVTSIAIENITFENCEIDTLLYNGAFAEFKNCEIKSIILYGNSMGAVEFGGAISFSPSLIKDTQLMTLTGSTGVGDWTIGYTSTINMLKRMDDNLKGRILRLNPENKSGLIRLDHKAISVKPNTLYAVRIKSSAYYPSGVSNIGKQIKVIYQDATQTEISNQHLYPNRTSTQSESLFNTETAFIQTPANTAYIVIQLSPNFSTTTINLDIANIFLHEVYFQKQFATVSESIQTDKSYASQIPTAISSVKDSLYLKDDVLYNLNPIAGGYIGWVCLASGNAGTWKGFGIIEA